MSRAEVAAAASRRSTGALTGGGTAAIPLAQSPGTVGDGLAGNFQRRLLRARAAATTSLHVAKMFAELELVCQADRVIQ